MRPSPESISGRTRLLGILADPVSQARSPAMANVLLELAKTKGRIIHTGVPMLAEQMELMLRFMSAEV